MHPARAQNETCRSDDHPAVVREAKRHLTYGFRKLYDAAKDVQLDVLVEVHDLPEMERALDLEADLIGINNRNLKTFKTDLIATEQLAEEVPESVVLVSESGLKNPDDAQRALDAGSSAILIGETLMRADDPSRAIEEYLALRLETEGE